MPDELTYLIVVLALAAVALAVGYAIWARKRPEAPELALERTILELQKRRRACKEELLTASTDKKLTEKRLRDERKATESWSERVQLAEQAENETLAEVARERLTEHEEQIEDYLARIEAFAQQIEAQKAELQALDDQIEELLEEKDSAER